MLDIGFSELMVIGVVALVVIGPERLPKVARTAGLLMGRMQRYVSDVKADINREMEMSELKDLKNTVTEAATSMQDAVTSHVGEISQELRKTEEEFGRLTNPMMHFGTAASSGGGEAGTGAAETLESSAQLELGLDAGADHVSGADAGSARNS